MAKITPSAMDESPIVAKNAKDARYNTDRSKQICKFADQGGSERYNRQHDRPGEKPRKELLHS
jgi:hypothetical protein